MRVQRDHGIRPRPVAQPSAKHARRSQDPFLGLELYGAENLPEEITEADHVVGYLLRHHDIQDQQA